VHHIGFTVLIYYDARSAKHSGYVEGSKRFETEGKVADTEFQNISGNTSRFYTVLTPTRRAIHIQSNNEARSRIECYRGKTMSITYSECVFAALGIQNSKRMRQIISSSVACLSLS
jgi:hypothetical protein